MLTGSAYSVFQTGLILGVGIVSALDEMILHHLPWDTFYVHTHPFGRNASEGRFHLGGSGSLAPGLGWALRKGRRPALRAE